jgi:hypothetical protein
VYELNDERVDVLDGSEVIVGATTTLTKLRSFLNAAESTLCRVPDRPTTSIPNRIIHSYIRLRKKSLALLNCKN